MILGRAALSPLLFTGPRAEPSDGPELMPMASAHAGDL